jgi:Icc-related predicted phosphoesterase
VSEGGALAAVGAPVRIAAYADVHCYEELRGRLGLELEHANRKADVLVLAGDLTLNGRVDEAVVLADELRCVKIPILAVLGNHDYELDEQARIAHELQKVGVRVLDGDAVTLDLGKRRVGFTGVKGFCGGFNDRLVAPFGEQALKAFVRVGQAETAKLDAGLRRLRQNGVDHVAVVVHYAPVRDTVIGEPPELFPYLGNSSLADPIDRHESDVVFHGHAHYGTPFGRTSTGIPVYNVARPLVRDLVIHVVR